MGNGSIAMKYHPAQPLAFACVDSIFQSRMSFERPPLTQGTDHALPIK